MRRWCWTGAGPATRHFLDSGAVDSLMPESGGRTVLRRRGDGSRASHSTTERTSCCSEVATADLVVTRDTAVRVVCSISAQRSQISMWLVTGDDPAPHTRATLVRPRARPLPRGAAKFRARPLFDLMNFLSVARDADTSLDTSRENGRGGSRPLGAKNCQPAPATNSNSTPLSGSEIGLNHPRARLTDGRWVGDLHEDALCRAALLDPPPRSGIEVGFIGGRLNGQTSPRSDGRTSTSTSSSVNSRTTPLIPSAASTAALAVAASSRCRRRSSRSDSAIAASRASISPSFLGSLRAASSILALGKVVPP